MPRFGELPGLDHHLTPEDEDERTEEEIQADQDAKDDHDIARAEAREDDCWDGPWV